MIRQPKSCELCGSPVLGRRPGSPGRFCSASCWYKANTRFEKNCRQCGKPKSRYSLTCMECSITRKRRKPRLCVVCNMPFTHRGSKYCSLKCLGIHKRVSELQHVCSCCQKQFEKVRARTRKGKNTFCSRECQHAFFKENRHPSWRGNRRQERGKDWPVSSAKARTRDGNLCVNCESEDGKRISVDHIVPFRLAKQCTEKPNELVNLACMCRSCHSTKTGIESRLLKGDVIGFMQEMNSMGGMPFERVQAALKYCGLIKPDATV